MKYKKICHSRAGGNPENLCTSRTTITAILVRRPNNKYSNSQIYEVHKKSVIPAQAGIQKNSVLHPDNNGYN